ncbi:hypothetical protein DT065_05720 [Salicibibacter kimchii]|uniref:Uncharacterized protein n=1 Tax=Salicibibacter kimchii TaxID=2099786 RepID=A0A345BX86_9BACI|nr:hypothetical protein DT065_05720 [Salicibibacter kimchii]
MEICREIEPNIYVIELLDINDIDWYHKDTSNLLGTVLVLVLFAAIFIYLGVKAPIIAGLVTVGAFYL